MRRKNQYVPRDPIRDYFPLPNEIFSLGLTTGEIAVYAYLMYCEDRKTFQCHPSYNTIGKAVKMTTKTVAKVREVLTEARSHRHGADDGHAQEREEA